MNRVNWIIMRFENIYIHNYHFKTKQLLLWAFQGLINMLIQFNTHLINRWLAVCGKTKHTNNMKRKKGHFFLWYISLSRIQVGYFCIKGWNELRQPYTTEYDYPSYTITLVTESLSVMVHDRKITSPLAFELIEFLTPEFLETPLPKPCLWTHTKLLLTTATSVSWHWNPLAV